MSFVVPNLKANGPIFSSFLLTPNLNPSLSSEYFFPASGKTQQLRRQGSHIFFSPCNFVGCGWLVEEAYFCCGSSWERGVCVCCKKSKRQRRTDEKVGNKSPFLLGRGPFEKFSFCSSYSSNPGTFFLCLRERRKAPPSARLREKGLQGNVWQARPTRPATAAAAAASHSATRHGRHPLLRPQRL